MRTIILCLIACVLYSCAEEHKQPKAGRIFEFKEIGWTINLPENFEVLDSSAIAARVENGKKLAGASNADKVDISTRKTLIVATKGKGGNGFMSFLTPLDKEDNSWENSLQLGRELMFQTLQQQFPTIKLDSSKSVETIDSLTFTKFSITGNESGRGMYHSISLSKEYKGYGLAINYVCIDEATKVEIETMLKESKFAR